MTSSPFHRIALLPQELQDKILLQLLRARLWVGEISVSAGFEPDNGPLRMLQHRARGRQVDGSGVFALNKRWSAVATTILHCENHFRIDWGADLSFWHGAGEPSWTNVDPRTENVFKIPIERIVLQLGCSASSYHFERTRGDTEGVRVPDYRTLYLRSKDRCLTGDFSIRSFIRLVGLCCVTFVWTDPPNADYCDVIWAADGVPNVILE